MRRIFLASVATLFATSALAAPHFNVTGGTVSAGKPVNFIIHRTSRDQSGAVVTFTTADGTARAGTDYAGTSSVISFPNGFSSLVVPVATYVDQAHLGTTLQFSGRIKVSGRVASTAGGNIVEPTLTPPPPPPPPPPTIPPTTAVEPVVSPNGLKGEFDVADNFDVQPTLEPTIETIPVDADPIAAFRFTCASGALAYDDPIVYPGQPGKSHLHQFFGNTLTDANTTYNSLRTTGGSTCTMTTSNSPQRSAYWQPAMLDGAGNVVKPNYLLTYYKNFPNGNPECNGAPDATHLGWCIPMPNGMRVLSGTNISVPGDSTLNPNSAAYGIQFTCETGDTHQSLSGFQHSIADVVATGRCNVPGVLLRINVSFPNCWDGKNLDVTNHRSHLVYGSGTIIDNYSAACPADHPYLVPVISMQTFFTPDANFFAGKWHLSSDEMVPGAVAGQTMHADYWEAWSPVVKNDWQTGCIDKHLSCNVGEMGNGQSIKGMNPSDFGGYPVNPLVPVSSIPHP